MESIYAMFSQYRSLDQALCKFLYYNRFQYDMKILENLFDSFDFPGVYFFKKYKLGIFVMIFEEVKS